MKRKIMLICAGFIIFVSSVVITTLEATDFFKQKDDYLSAANELLNEIESPIEIEVGEKTTISTENYTYSIKDNDVAAITKDNQLFGVAAGTRDIQIENEYGQTRTIKVIVKSNKIKNSPNTITIGTTSTTLSSTLTTSTVLTTTNSSTTEKVITTIKTEKETIATTTTEKIVEKIVYKPSTHYVHRSTCQWASEECYEITTTEGIEARLCDECNPNIEIITLYEEPITSNLSFVKTFTRGTYYAYGGGRCGGSGRSLIDCSWGNGTVKGSIASSYLYNLYGYNYNGRTMVYLEVKGYPSMNGYYYVDDSDAGNSNVIDFFYYYGSNCQFRNQGVVSVDCYIVR